MATTSLAFRQPRFSENDSAVCRVDKYATPKVVLRFGRLAPGLVGCILLVTSACDEHDRPSTGGSGVAALPSTKPSAPRAPAGPLGSNSRQEPPPPTTAAEADSSTSPDASPDTSTASTTWSLSEISDIGPAGPAAAVSQGVVLITRDNRLVSSVLKKDGEFTPINGPREEFVKFGRGPAIAGGHAHWISTRGQLLRAPLRGGETEVLAERAHSGARVAAALVADQTLVAFVADVDQRLVAMLWTSQGELLRLTPEGANTTSVQLIPRDRTAIALSLEGRSSMSPVHARLIRVAKRRINLEQDQVVWVGPGTHPLSELRALGLPSGKTAAFLATARDITHFGLAHFVVEPSPSEIHSVQWRPYPNGIDPAPVAATRACSGEYVFYAQPSSSAPRAPQELRVARLDEGHPGEPELLARSRAFNDITVASTSGGVVLAWTADRRTWGLRLGCPKSSR